MLQGPFSTKELGELAGLSDHMINYLCRYGMLRPSELCPGRRGARRGFSFADVVFARTISKLLTAGASVVALRRALATLRQKLKESPPTTILGTRVVIVRQSVYFVQSDRELVNLTANGQLAFHFILDAPGAKVEDVRRRRSNRPLSAKRA